MTLTWIPRAKPCEVAYPKLNVGSLPVQLDRDFVDPPATIRRSAESAVLIRFRPRLLDASPAMTSRPDPSAIATQMKRLITCTTEKL